MTSRHEKSLTMFSIAFMGLWPSFWVIPRRRPFPIPSRKFGPRCKKSLEPVLRIALDGRYVFGLVSPERITTNGTILGFCAGDATPLAESGRGRSLRRHASHLDDARCGADTFLGQASRSLFRSRSATHNCARCSCRRRRRATQRSGSHIRIERRLHLSSPRVSVDAVLERDGRQLDVREHKVKAAVAEDDHCEVSRWRDLWLRHHVDVQNPRATNRYAGGKDLTLTRDNSPCRVAKKVWTDAALLRLPPACVRLSQSRTNHYQWHCLGFCSGDATPLAESGSGKSLRRSSASQLDEAELRCANHPHNSNVSCSSRPWRSSRERAGQTKNPGPW